MAKYFLSILIVSTMSVTCFGQTTKQKLDQAKNDPKTTQNAAKADVQLINKKNVADSSVAKTIIIKRKEQGCRSKRKKN